MRVFIYTLGCPKNLVDSQRVAARLEDEGHELVNSPEEADLTLLNTCSFLQEAVQEAWETARELARSSPVALIGCLPARYPKVKRVLGEPPEGWEGVLRLADEVFQRQEGPRLVEPRPWAYLKVAEGCNRRCSFCVIPRIRGRLRSRPLEEVVAEAAALLALGKVELVLIAQDLGLYGVDIGRSLAELLVELDKLEGDFLIRLMYLNPGALSAKLFRLLASMDHLAPYLHVPVQHASEKVLRGMRRAGGARAVRNLLRWREKFLPDAFLRTELMVGFPGEGETDFQELLALIRSGEFQRMAVFKFSPEEPAPASRWEGVPEEVKEERYEIALSEAWSAQLRAQESLVGQEVLVVNDPEAPRTVYDAPEVDFGAEILREAKSSLLWGRVKRVSNEGDLLIEPL